MNVQPLLRGFDPVAQLVDDIELGHRTRVVARLLERVGEQCVGDRRRAVGDVEPDLGVAQQKFDAVMVAPVGIGEPELHPLRRPCGADAVLEHVGRDHQIQVVRRPQVVQHQQIPRAFRSSRRHG